MFPLPIDFKSCRVETAGALQAFCNRWCKREHIDLFVCLVFNDASTASDVSN